MQISISYYLGIFDDIDLNDYAEKLTGTHVQEPP